MGNFQRGILDIVNKIKLPTKSILKNDKTSLKLKGKGLAFGSEFFPTKTKVSYFLAGIVFCEPST